MGAFIRAFTSFRMFMVLVLGFASGLPLALTGSTLQAWMTVEGVDLKMIGLFGLVGLPYTVKFIWAPLLDRYVPAWRGRILLGRRRGWILLSQLVLIGAFLTLGAADPAAEPGWVALIALVIAGASATQDIVIDAWRTEILREDEFGAGAAVGVFGYRLGMLTSGALGLVLSEFVSWGAVYGIMALCLGATSVALFVAPEPVLDHPPPRSIGAAVSGPLVEFFQRPGAVEILLFIVLYKVGDVMAAALTTPFMLGLGFSRAEIGTVVKGLGLLATIVGGLVGGGLMAMLGLRRALLYFGVLQAVSTIMFAVLAEAGKNHLVMAAAIGIENLCGGFGTAALAAFLMSLCSRRFTATQYALLTSLAAVTRTVAGAPTGYLVDLFGWTQFFLLCTGLAVPGLLMITLRFTAWERGSK